MASSFVKGGIKALSKGAIKGTRKATTKAVKETGEQFFKRMDKEKLVPEFFSDITRSDMIEQINLQEGTDNVDLESMFRGYAEGNTDAHKAVMDYTTTLSGASHYQNRYESLRRKVYPNESKSMVQTAATPQSGVIKGSSARNILGNQQIATPPTKRAPSIPPNLPQEVIDEYTQEAAPRLRAGEKNRKDIPYLIDEDDKIYRLDQQGWEYVRTATGDTVYQKKYGLIDVDLKRARNAKLNKIRQQKVNLTTKAGTDQRDFYNDPDIEARHKKGLEEPHHRAPLHPSARLKSGLSKREGTILDNYLESKGIVTGNSKYNRDNLPNEVHKKLHSWLKKNKLLTGNEDLTGLSLAQRKKYIDKFIADMKKSDEKTFKVMQAFTRLKKSKTK